MISFILRIIHRMKARYKRWNKRIVISKRQQYVAITMLMSVFLIITQVFSSEFRYFMVGVIAIIAYFLTAYALREDLRGIEWFTLLSLPSLFTAAISIFYFLLPERWLTRLPIVMLYAVGFYALLLTENIYNVAVNRTIALLRAAHTVGFLLTLVTFFLLLQTLFSLHTYPFITVPVVFVLAFILSLQFSWSLILENTIAERVWFLSLISAIVVAQCTFILSFWPVNTTIQSLFITSLYYSVSGMSQQYLQERLYKKTIQEFFIVTAIVFFILIYVTNWHGM